MPERHRFGPNGQHFGAVCDECKRLGLNAPETIGETNARLHRVADMEGAHDYVGIESVTVYDLVTDCPLCGHALPTADPWPSECVMCRGFHKVCAGCGGHIRWGGLEAPTEVRSE